MQMDCIRFITIVSLGQPSPSAIFCCDDGVISLSYQFDRLITLFVLGLSLPKKGSLSHFEDSMSTSVKHHIVSQMSASICLMSPDREEPEISSMS